MCFCKLRPCCWKQNFVSWRNIAGLRFFNTVIYLGYHSVAVNHCSSLLFALFCEGEWTVSFKVSLKALQRVNQDLAAGSKYYSLENIASLWFFNSAIWIIFQLLLIVVFYYCSCYFVKDSGKLRPRSEFENCSGGSKLYVTRCSFFVSRTQNLLCYKADNITTSHQSRNRNALINKTLSFMNERDNMKTYLTTKHNYI